MGSAKARKFKPWLIGGGVVAALYLFWPQLTHPAYIAGRTSPSFERRPTNDSLVQAAGEGNMTTLKKLLDSGVSPNADSSGNEGRSALSEAASNGQLSAVKLLLDRGADVNADDFWGGNALVGASLFGRVDVVKLLIAHGADPNMDDDGATALGYASHQLIEHNTDAPLANYRAIVGILESDGATSSPLAGHIARLFRLMP